MAKKKKRAFEMHIVSHTHWDREWRMTFQQFRMKLVECIDHLLDIMDREPGYKHFTLDGQSSLIEDYLEIRPEREEKIRELVGAGRLLLGPWYTLIDEALVWGESIVRNLLRGHEIAHRLGGVMKVGYSISSFGHIGQLPQIYAGFGISKIIFSRGISDWQVKSEFIWEGADGTRALAFHLPDDYTKSNWFYVVYRPALIGMAADCWRYEWGTLGLPFHACDEASLNHFYRLFDLQLQYDASKIFQCVKQLRDECAATATTPHLLFMDGVDHLEPNPYLARIIKDVNRRLRGDRLVHSTLPDYMEKVEKALGKLEVVRGEMRTTTREGVHNPLLAGVLSARMDLKQMNQNVQTELIRWAEPFCCVAWMLGFPYPQSYLDIAWRNLLQNHAHDSICGCSIDAVHNDMEYRFQQSGAIAEELVQRAFWQIVPEIDNSALDENDMAITVFNSLPYSRDEVISVGVDMPEEWGARAVMMIDLKGNEVPVQIRSIEHLCPELLNPLNAQLSPHMNRFMLYFPAKSVPSLGWTTFIAKPLKKAYKRHPGTLVTGRNTMENAFLRVRIEDNGCLEITEKTTGAVFRGVHFFEDGGDTGDAWKYVPPMLDEIFTSTGCSVVVSLVDDGPILARYQIEYHLRLPEKVLPKKPKMIVEEAEPKAAGRSKVRREYVITSLVTLASGGRRVDITTRLDNVVKDHRLRVMFPSGIRGAKVSAAEGQFDVVERAIKLPDTSGWKEQAFSTHPQLGFVDVSDGTIGLAVINEGLTEFAVLDDAQRTIALTLLRCVGRSIGEDYEQRGGQCLGEHEFRYALYPHAGTWESADVFLESLRRNTPLKATQSKRYSKGTLPQQASFLRVSPTTIVVSALKQSTRGDSLILRLYNPTSSLQKCRIAFPFRRFTSARLVNLLEEPEHELSARSSNAVTLDLGAKQIATIELFF